MFVVDILLKKNLYVAELAVKRATLGKQVRRHLCIPGRSPVKVVAAGF